MIPLTKLTIHQSAYFCFQHAQDKLDDITKIEKSKDVNQLIERYNNYDKKLSEHVKNMADTSFKKVLERDNRDLIEEFTEENIKKSREIYDMWIDNFITEECSNIKDHYFRLFERNCLTLIRRIIKERPRNDPVMKSFKIDKNDKSCEISINKTKLGLDDKKNDEILEDVKNTLIPFKFTEIKFVIN